MMPTTEPWADELIDQLAATLARRDQLAEAVRSSIAALVVASGEHDRVLEAAHPMTESSEVPSGAVVLGGQMWQSLDVVPLLRQFAERAHGEAYQVELARRRALPPA